MAKLGINTGSNADDGTGDSLRVGAGKINSNFNEVYSLLTGAGNNGSTLLSGIVTSITAGTNISLTGGPTGAIQIASSAVAGSGKFVTNSTGIHTLGSVGIGTTTAENNGLSVLGNVKVGKGVTTLNLNVSGVSTFSGGDINISGDNYTLMWDASVDTLEFGDNAKIAFGAGSDLTLYHDGSNSYVKDQAAGNLYLDSNGTAVVISKAGAAESMADFQTDGPVRLFYNNARKFETISTGATVVGDLHISNGVNIAGVVTANKFLGDGSGLSNLPGINTSGTSNFTNLRVSGVSTFAGDASVGVSTLFVDVSRGQIGLGTDVLTGSHLLDVDGSAVFAGLSTFSGGLVSDGDATFKGAAYNMTWDKSGNELNFPVTSSNSGRLIFGSTSYEALELKILSSVPTIQSHNQGITVQTDSGYDITLNSADDIILKNSAQSNQNWYIKCTESGVSGISSVALYAGGNGTAAEKLRTDLHGVIITGVTTATKFVGELSSATLHTNPAGISVSGVATATTFSGALTGNVTGNASGSSGSCSGNAATATEATNVTVTANNSGNETVYPLFVDGATGTQGAETDTGLYYNPLSGALNSTSFVGSLTGTVVTVAQPNITSLGTLSSLNVSGKLTGGITHVTNIVGAAASIAGIVTATTFSGALTGNVTGNASGSSGSCSGNAATATVGTTITIADESSDTTCFPLFATAATGNLGAKSGTNLTFNSSTGDLAATSFNGGGNDIVTSRWTLGADGSSNYTFTGPGGLSGANDPTIYLARGQTYEFVNGMGAHPFEIRVSDGGSAYNTGVTNNGASSGTIKFEVPFAAPNTLVYQCTAHAGMLGSIVVYPSI